MFFQGKTVANFSHPLLYIELNSDSDYFSIKGNRTPVLPVIAQKDP